MTLFKNSSEFIQYFDIRCGDKKILSYLTKNVPKDNEYVDEIIKYIIDDHSYKNWYAMQLLVSINTEYCVKKALENKLLDKHIMELYWNFSHLSEVKEYMKDCVIKSKYIGDKPKYRPIDILFKEKNNTDAKYYLIDIYNYYLNQSYPSEGTCISVLKQLKSHYTEPDVRKIYDYSINSGNICLVNKTKQILMHDYIGPELFKKINIKLINDYVDTNKFSHLLYFCKKNIKTDLITNVEHRVQNFINYVKSKFELRRADREDVCYGLNPLGGFSDYTYQDYFDALICLSLIGKHTKNELIFFLIYNFIDLYINTDRHKGKYFKGDHEVSLDLFHTLSKNLLFGQNIKEKNDKNSIYTRFKLHSNESTSHDVIRDRILALIYFHEISEDKDEKEYSRLEISNYYNTEYCWMRGYYIVDEEKMKNIIESKI